MIFRHVEARLLVNTTVSIFLELVVAIVQSYIASIGCLVVQHELKRLAVRRETTSIEAWL